MKKTILSALLAAVAAVTARAQGVGVISWSDTNGNVFPATGTAGIVAVTNWNGSNPGNNGGFAALRDSSNNATGAGFTITGTYGGWGISAIPNPDSDGTYNRKMLAGYANTSSGAPNGPTETFAITNIPYPFYSVIAYFSSDTTNRVGTVSCGGTTYSFTTLGNYAVTNGTGTGTTNAVFIPTADTTGGNPAADYAIFTNLSGASQNLVLSIPNGGGMAAFQIVQQTNVALSLSSDTTASPSTNVYVGGTVIFSAAFGGTPPLTNQWKVNTGGGFVIIAGATNSTLTLTNVQHSDAGAYALFASNIAGASNSTPLALNVLDFPTNNLGINVQFIGSWLDGNAPVQSGAAVIGNGGDVWNAISNPTGSASVAGTARGTNLVLFDTVNVTTPITMDYIADYIFNGTAFGFGNPFTAVGSPYANLMSGYMGSVTTSGPDTNTIILRNLTPGIYDIYFYVCGRSDGQGRVDVLFANDQSAVCGPNSNSFTLTAGQNYVHLTPTVTTNGVLNISFYGTTDNGQGLLNGFQLNGPDTNVSLTLSSDTTCDSPLNDYVGRTLTFSAAFAGFPKPSLQWEVNKGSGYLPITGATNSTLTLADMQTTDSGQYALLATNAAGNLTSTGLMLNVQPLPSLLSIDVQFDGTSYTGTHSAAQVGPAVIGNASDFWNPVSNPNPVGADTNPISGSVLLSDVSDYGTPLTLDYTGNQDYDNAGSTPFNGSGSPAANLMQGSLVTINGTTGTVTVHGLPAGVFDLYLYSCASSAAQQTVTRFSANDAYDTCGPNETNNALTLGTNYIHLTPTVAANGLLNISFVGRATSQGNLNGIQVSGPGATPQLPVANFSGSPRNIYMAQSVTFTDASSGNITNWVWNFGDGNTLNTNASTSVTHAYAAAGTYTVSLIATGTGVSATNTQVNYVVVNPVPTVGRPVLSNGQVVVSGTGGIANSQYRILTAMDLSLPRASWTPVWTNLFAPDGSYSYTNSLTNSASFFRLVTP